MKSFLTVLSTEHKFGNDGTYFTINMKEIDLKPGGTLYCNVYNTRSMEYYPIVIWGSTYGADKGDAHGRRRDSKANSFKKNDKLIVEKDNTYIYDSMELWRFIVESKTPDNVTSIINNYIKNKKDITNINFDNKKCDMRYGYPLYPFGTGQISSKANMQHEGECSIWCDEQDTPYGCEYHNINKACYTVKGPITEQRKYTSDWNHYGCLKDDLK
jgi:hypothetical protein